MSLNHLMTLKRDITPLEYIDGQDEYGKNHRHD